MHWRCPADSLTATFAVKLISPVPLPKSRKKKKWGRLAMKDYLAHAEKPRAEAAECALIRDLATERDKREMCDRLSNHLTVLADQVEMAMNERRSGAEQERLQLPVKAAALCLRQHVF